MTATVRGSFSGVGDTRRRGRGVGRAFYRCRRPLPTSTPARAGDLECAMPAPRVLFVKLSSLGDVIHHFPAVSDLRAHRPEVAIDWAVEEAYAPLVRLHPAVARAIPVGAQAPARGACSLPAAWGTLAGGAARAARAPLRLDRRRAGPPEERGGRPARGRPALRLRPPQHPRAGGRALLRPGAGRFPQAPRRRAQSPARGRRVRLRARGSGGLRARRGRRGACAGRPRDATSWRCTPRAAATSGGRTSAGRRSRPGWRDEAITVVYPGGSPAERADAARLAAASPGALAAPGDDASRGGGAAGACQRRHRRRHGAHPPRRGARHAHRRPLRGHRTRPHGAARARGAS